MERIHRIPLNLRLRIKAQKEIAYVQDILVEELYKFFPDAVIHGGTAIWRCYISNRFSEDIDVYIVKNENKINDFFSSLESRGFKIIKKRIKENSFYSEMLFNNTPIRFEATFQIKKAIIKKYETSESFFINVYTLTPEELIKEKIAAYMKRKKIRDLYDIFFLLDYSKREDIEKDIKDLIKNFSDPKDEKNLATIIISGAVPNSKQLFWAIERWAR